MREAARGGPRSGGRKVVGVGVAFAVCGQEGGGGRERKVVCVVERLVFVWGEKLWETEGKAEQRETYPEAGGGAFGEDLGGGEAADGEGEEVVDGRLEGRAEEEVGVAGEEFGREVDAAGCYLGVFARVDWEAG